MIQSKFTPDLPHLCVVNGVNIFSDGQTFSIDDRLESESLEKIIDYLLDEGFIDDDDWIFLT
jgi:hypothetical protein